MADQPVCNIKFYCYVRLIFGFYHEFKSERARCFAKFYCIVIAALVMTSMISLGLLTNITPFFYVECTEYIVCIIISARKRNIYLLRYYRKTPLIDDTSKGDSYKYLKFSIIVTMCLIFVAKIISYLLTVWVLVEKMEFDLISVFDSIVSFAIVYEWFNLFLVLVLAYCRVVRMRQIMESSKFICRAQNKHHSREFIHMYQAILDSLDTTDDPLKFLSMIHIILKVPDSMSRIVSFFGFMRMTRVSLPMIILFVTDVMIPYVPLVLSAILADLITEEIREMLSDIAEKRMDCDNERDRAEIQELLQFMRNNPFSYTIWRVVPLNIHSLLIASSFCLTTIIAILQLTNF